VNDGIRRRSTCGRRVLRAVVTTNFDRLIELASTRPA